MNTSTSSRIAEYRFQDRKTGLWLLPVICLGAAIIMMVDAPLEMIADGNVVHSLLATVLIGTLIMIYNWRSRPINQAIFFSYLISVGIEYLVAGIPGAPGGYNFGSGHVMGKGIMMELFIYIQPYVYMLLKFGVAWPLWQISWK